MPSSSALLYSLLIAVSIVSLSLLAFLGYIWIRYSPIIGRIFEDAPVFQPLRAEPIRDGEDVRFPTADGFSLAGTYYSTRAPARAGVVVFCHEFLGDRGSASVYVQSLLELGFDLFTFDFRNHGESESEPGYSPLQWVSNRETRDLKAALAYLRKRPDADPAGAGLFGVSRGGSAAICVMAREPRVWGLLTDGAFPTRSTMLSYILRWAEIYVGSKSLWHSMPLWIFKFAGWAGRMRSQWRLGRRFPDVERAVAKLSPRPLMMIHGERDAYIGTDIARDLFNRAGEPKQLWLVPGAKHNRCREVDPDGYREHVNAFFRRFAPRGLSARSESSDTDGHELAAVGPLRPVPSPQ